MTFNNSVVLVTGGTGSFGKKFIGALLAQHKPRKIIVFSRDELKQHEMRSQFPEGPGSPMRYFLGDVRDSDRLQRAFHGVDIVVHAAALKQVPACEYNPFEAIQTNVLGAKNVIDAAIDQRVKKVMAISTDKAVNPVNLYGATKLCAEKLFVQGNSYAGESATRFSCARYGNVLGSRGSVVPVFLRQRKEGKLTITDARMTRFWLTLEQGVAFVMHGIEQMYGGEIFVPKIPSMKLSDMARLIAPECPCEVIGIRPGEKLHEMLIAEAEAPHTVETDSMYVIQPEHPYWGASNWPQARLLPEGFSYASNTNHQWLDDAEFRRLLDGHCASQVAAAGY